MYMLAPVIHDPAVLYALPPLLLRSWCMHQFRPHIIFAVDQIKL